MRPIIIAFLAALVLGNWPVHGMLLLIDDAIEQGEVAALAGVPRDTWREAHIDGALRLRGAALFALPLLLILAAALSLFPPLGKDAGWRPREEDFSF